MSALHYGDPASEETYTVELFDQVEARIDGHIHDGQVTKLHPRNGEATVRYLDELDATRSGDPRQKSRRVPVGDLALIARDG